MSRHNSVTLFYFILMLLTSSCVYLSFSFSLIPIPLMCHIHFKEAKPCSSEICEYIVRNVRPSWHYNTLYQLTRGVGGEWGGRKEDVEMLEVVWEWVKKKKRALCGCLSGRKWSDSMALAFGKIASFNRHSVEEASPDMRPHMPEQMTANEKKKENFTKRKETRGVF